MHGPSGQAAGQPGRGGALRVRTKRRPPTGRLGPWSPELPFRLSEVAHPAVAGNSLTHRKAGFTRSGLLRAERPWTYVYRLDGDAGEPLPLAIEPGGDKISGSAPAMSLTL